MADRRADLDNASIQALLDLGGNELLVDLVADFREFADGALECVRTAIAGGDCPAVREAAHSIKSTSATFGAHDLNRLLGDLESLATAGNIAAVGQLMPRIEDEKAAVDAALVERTRT